MRFGKNLKSIAIPEWKDCYLDYLHLKIFIKLLKDIVDMIEDVQDQLKNIKDDEEEQPFTENMIRLEHEEELKLAKILKELKKNGDKLNQFFYEGHNCQMDLNRTFIQMKLLQLKARFQRVKKLRDLNLEEEQNEIFLTLVQYIYIEAIYMENMKDTNQEGERKILKKHQKYMKQIFTSPRARKKKVQRLSRCMVCFIDDIENLYVQAAPGVSKKNREHLRELAKKSQSQTFDLLITGTWIGICISIFVVLLVILIYNGKNVQTDPIFHRDFPTWRGIAFFIFYIWILGMNTYMFEKYNVSHRLIFKHEDHHYSRAVDMFKLAGFFTTLFFLLFLIYTLEISQIANLDEVGEYYLTLFVWGAFFLYLIIPLPILNWRGRLFAWKMALISAISPFIGVTFPVIWLTDQLVSLVTPVKDFAYTICYYSELNLNGQVDPNDNPCSDATRVQVVLVVGAVAYGYRILQCMRQGYDNEKYIFQPQFWNTWKYICSLITLTLSYFWKAGDDNIFAAWLVFAIISTVYSYIWDIKMDWGLMESGTKNRFLRSKLTYSPINMYYIIMITNAIFRLAWLFTLSPSVAESFGSPHLFAFITGALEILRRGFWNLFRVEKEHLVNCRKFQAMPNKTSLEEKLLNKLCERENDEEAKEKIRKIFEEDKLQESKFDENFLPYLHETIEEEEAQKQKREEKVKIIKDHYKKLKKEFEAIMKKDS